MQWYEGTLNLKKAAEYIEKGYSCVQKFDADTAAKSAGRSTASWKKPLHGCKSRNGAVADQMEEMISLSQF